MERHTSRRFLLSLVLAGLFLSSTQCSSSSDTDPEAANNADELSSSAILYVSESPTHSSPTVLNGSAIEGSVYIFTSDSTKSANPVGIRQVRYWLDNPGMTGTPRQTENYTPYDFAGGAPWNTTTISQGTHTISESVTLTSGAIQNLTVSFTVGKSSQCKPSTCAALGKDCGAVTDGCGGTLSCGTCGFSETCGGGGEVDVCGTSTVGVNQYYVSTSGADGNDGSAAHPWATITHASAALTLGAAGATVHVAPGTYDECVSTTHTGTATQRIRYISDTQWAAKVACDGSTRPASQDAVWANGTGSNTRTADYVDIIGFEITAANPSNMCLGIDSYGAYALVRGNYVHDVLGNVAQCPSGGAGIMLSNNGCGNLGNCAQGVTIAHDSVVDANVIDNVGTGSGGAGTSCPTIHGIYVATLHNLTSNNVVSRACGWGIHLNHDVPSNSVSNNVTINNYRGGIAVASQDGYCASDVTVNNNIAAFNGASEAGIGDRYDHCGTGSLYNDNFYYENAGGNFSITRGAQTGAVVLTSTQWSGLFVSYTGNAKTGNYHLKSGSAAEAAGTSGDCAPGGFTPCVPSTDFDGRARPSYSVGAFE